MLVMHHHHCSAAAQAVSVLCKLCNLFGLKDVMFVLRDQQLLDVLFKDTHCFVDGLWSLLAMSP